MGIFLFPYASTKEQLRSMCKTAFGALRPGDLFRYLLTQFLQICMLSSGGRFIGASTMHGGGEELQKKWKALGYCEIAWPGSECGEQLEDGGKVELTIFGIDRKTRVVIPNYLWSREAISEALLEAGFSKVDWQQERFSGDEDKDWAKTAKNGFGLNGFFVALMGNE